MLLTIDVGNTHTVLGLFEGATLRHHWRLRTDVRRTADEYGLFMRELLGGMRTGVQAAPAPLPALSRGEGPGEGSRRGLLVDRPAEGTVDGAKPSPPPSPASNGGEGGGRGISRVRKANEGVVTGIAVSSVVPPLNQVLDAACRTYLQATPLFIGPGVATGMPVLYDNPHQLGSDRLANAVAGFARTGGATIVVDLGTATKFEYVSAAGAYIGGAIAPGLGIAGDALFERAARLYRVEIAKPERVLGRNTVHAIQSGLVYGYVAMVDGMVRRIRAEHGGAARVVATGGFAPLVATEAACIDEIDEFLTLDGVRLIYARNSAH